MTPVRLEPVAPQSQVKDSTTEPLRSPACKELKPAIVFIYSKLFWIWANDSADRKKVYTHIFTFSKQAFNESLDFCNCS